MLSWQEGGKEGGREGRAGDDKTLLLSGWQFSQLTLYDILGK